MKFENTVYDFLKELCSFHYKISCIDLIWDLIFPDSKGKWNYVSITKYKQTFFINHINGHSCSLEVVPSEKVSVMKSFGISAYEDGSENPARVWGHLIQSAYSWLYTVKKDWIKANRIVQEQYPLYYRLGIVPNSLIRASLPKIYRLDQDLGKLKTRKFIRLVEDGYFLKEENTIADSMTAKDYFEYCRIAYIAGKRKVDSIDESLSGREMYKRYADGRHEGLLDIDENSQQEFSDWIDGKHTKKTRGGHPWEIKRGGNTTHIDLHVSRPNFYKKERFKVELCGASINRLKETVQMFLGIYNSSLPISIADPEGIRKRLLAQDNIGIIPSYNSLHRANQYFREDQYVYDVFYYNELGRYKRRITPFITWEPLPILKLKEI